MRRGVPVLGIVVEVQLARDDRKRFAWPVYVATLRARLECAVCVLVVTADEAIARWAARPIDLVLSAMAHGREPDTAKSVQIALVAQLASEALDDEQSALYFDLILSSLSEAARRALQAMKPANYEYQSDFARQYFQEALELR